MPLRNVRVVALSVAALLPLRAQDETPPVVRGVEATLLPEITSRLRSDDAGTVAWGAHLAAKHRVTAAVPELRAKLATLTLTSEAESRFAVLALLDALVQTDAVVPLAELRPFLRGLSRTPALVLLARDLDANRDFFVAEVKRLEVEGAWTERIVCGNLLAAVKDPDFAVDLLRSVRITLHVLVRDPGDEPYFGRGSRGGSSFRSGDGALGVPVNHPPTALYTLSRTLQRGDVVFAPGPRPVFLRRTVREGRQFGIGDSDSQLDGELEETRIEWLAKMLDQPVVLLPLDFDTDALIDWRGAEAFAVSMREQRERIAAEHRKLLDMCVETRLLPREAVAGIKPALDVEVRDKRKDQTVPLPEHSPAAK